MNEKTFRTNTNIGTCKYLVYFHNGVSTHKDGSPFSDCHIFRNKRKANQFIRSLKKAGYPAECFR